MGVRLLGLVLCAALVLGSGGTTAEPQSRTVTIQGDRVPLSQALKELAKIAPVEDRRGEDDPKLMLDLKGATFWQAVDAIAEATRSRVSISPQKRQIALVKPAGPGKAHLSHDGPFRIALKRLSVSRDLESGNHGSGFFELAWEPSLQPFYLETRPQNLVVKDDQGQPLPRLELGSSVAPVDGRIALLFEVPLPAPARTVPRLGVIEGQFSALAPTRMLQFPFASLEQLARAAPNAALRTQTQAGITCRVGKVTLASERWTIQMIVDAPPGGSKLESFQSWLGNNELVLVSKDGKQRLTSSSDVEESVTGRTAVVSYNFTDREGRLRGKPEDWTVQYTTPGGVVVLPIPFRFTDVPLP